MFQWIKSFLSVIAKTSGNQSKLGAFTPIIGQYLKDKNLNELGWLCQLSSVGNNIRIASSVDKSLDLLNNLSGGTGIIKQGYLIKEGNNNKPWRRRWFVLTDTKEMRYFKQLGDRPLGVFPIEKAFVCRCSKKSFCFQIETLQRTYFLAASSYESMKNWMEVLEENGAIIKKDGQEGVVKAGWLRKEGNRNRPWKQRYFVIYETKEVKYFTKPFGVQKGSFALKGSTISADKKRENGFQLNIQGRTYYFQAADKRDLKEWMCCFAENGSTVISQNDSVPKFIDYFDLEPVSKIEVKREQKQVELTPPPIPKRRSLSKMEGNNTNSSSMPEIPIRRSILKKNDNVVEPEKRLSADSKLQQVLKNVSSTFTFGKPIVIDNGNTPTSLKFYSQ